MSSERSRQPYSTILPYSIKVYPIIQTARQVSYQSAEHWPRAMPANLSRWQATLSHTSDMHNQIYVHIPFCPFLCPFCPLYKVTDAKQRNADSYEHFVQTLIQEIELYGRHDKLHGEVFHAVYFGGGTPTQLNPNQLKRILTALRQNFTIVPDAEVTLEGVARQMLQPDYLAECLDSGFNRISYGVQSLNQSVRNEIGRGDRVEDYLALAQLAKRLDPNLPVNIDMLCGLPGQTEAILRADLEQIVTWPIDSLDMLYYVMMQGTLLQRLIREGERAQPTFGEPLLQMREMIYELMAKNGFHQVTGEVFTRNDRDLFTHTSFGGGTNSGLNTVLALGPSAFGMINGTLYQNVADLNLYQKAVGQALFPLNTAETLTAKKARRRATLLSLLQLKIPSNDIMGLEGFWLLKDWAHKQLIVKRDNHYQMTDLGKLWYNHMQLDVLSLADKLTLLRFLGSTGDQLELVKKEVVARHPYEEEIIRFIRCNGQFGPLNMILYRAYLMLQKTLYKERGAMKFTGNVTLL